MANAFAFWDLLLEGPSPPPSKVGDDEPMLGPSHSSLIAPKALGLGGKRTLAHHLMLASILSLSLHLT